jgi:ion channel-forming bestrophin family protein
LKKPLPTGRGASGEFCRQEGFQRGGRSTIGGGIASILGSANPIHFKRTLGNAREFTEPPPVAQREIGKILGMLVREVIAPLTSSKTLLSISSLALAMGLYAVLPVIKELSVYRTVGDAPSDLHAALSLVLGWLLVFRTNAAYARWWEARSLWGVLVNASRNLAIKLKTLSRPDAAETHYLALQLSAFPRALMQHLRKAPFEHQGVLVAASPHPPLAIVEQVYAWVSQRKAEGRIDGDELRVIDSDLAKLLDVCGGCEKISRTPIVRSYRTFARQCIFLFLFTLPWGLVEDFQWWTIPLTIVISYFMIGMEIVAEHVEEPFGYDEDFDRDRTFRAKPFNQAIETHGYRLPL